MGSGRRKTEKAQGEEKRGIGNQVEQYSAGQTVQYNKDSLRHTASEYTRRAMCYVLCTVYDVLRTSLHAHIVEELNCANLHGTASHIASHMKTTIRCVDGESMENKNRI